MLSMVLCPVVARPFGRGAGVSSVVLARLFPEIHFGDFSRFSHRVIFYSRVNALLTPEMTVLEFGAGRGKWAETERGYLGRLTALKGKCAKVIGADVDSAVRENPQIDEAVLIAPDGTMAVPDSSVDLIVSWAVFEHLDDPRATAAELSRVLKPGGYICAWTPNKWSYLAIAARLVPNRLHAKVLSRMNIARGAEDIFPTRYRVNTRGAIRKFFPPPQYANGTYIFNGDPAYHAGSVTIARVWRLWAWLMPLFFGQALHVFLRKHGGGAAKGEIRS
jgi:SAM-dependent methyltransferase